MSSSSTGAVPQRFDVWIASLEARHLADLRFAEVSRALRALSSAYVERRHALAEGAALDGAGKRAAFALFYGPLHFLLAQHIVASLPDALHGIRTLIDLGCGTGASGAAWASACDRPPRVVGIDRHPWALGEAVAAYKVFGLDARIQQGDVVRGIADRKSGLSPSNATLAAFTVNELSDATRGGMLPHLLDRAERGGRVLVIEPIGRVVGRWWNEWRDEFERAGGRADEWRFRTELPPIVAKLDRAAGLNHREITGRSLWLATRAASPSSSN